MLAQKAWKSWTDKSGKQLFLVFQGTECPTILFRYKSSSCVFHRFMFTFRFTKFLLPLSFLLNVLLFHLPFSSDFLVQGSIRFSDSQCSLLFFAQIIWAHCLKLFLFSFFNCFFSLWIFSIFYFLMFSKNCCFHYHFDYALWVQLRVGW